MFSPEYKAKVQEENYGDSRRIIEEELEMIESMANNKLMDISHIESRGRTETIFYACMVDQKPIAESIIEKVRKM